VLAQVQGQGDLVMRALLHKDGQRVRILDGGKGRRAIVRVYLVRNVETQKYGRLRLDGPTEEHVRRYVRDSGAVSINVPSGGGFARFGVLATDSEGRRSTEANCKGQNARFRVIDSDALGKIRDAEAAVVAARKNLTQVLRDAFEDAEKLNKKNAAELLRDCEGVDYQETDDKGEG